MPAQQFRIRPAMEKDAEAILEMIQGLALFEKAPEKVEINARILREDGFGEKPAFHSFVAESEEGIVGFSLSYVRYSTWRGKVCFVEDLFVKVAWRGKGLGKHLLDAQMDWARTQGACRCWIGMSLPSGSTSNTRALNSIRNGSMC